MQVSVTLRRNEVGFRRLDRWKGLNLMDLRGMGKWCLVWETCRFLRRCTICRFVICPVVQGYCEFWDLITKGNSVRGAW